MKTNKFLQLKSHTDLTVFRVSQVVFTRVTKFLYVLVLFCFGWLAGWLVGWLVGCFLGVGLVSSMDFLV